MIRVPRPGAAILAGLTGLILIGVVLRVYRLPELLVLGPDQARDALVVVEMLQTGQLASEGPIASLGTYHRGPAYYYLLAPAYALSNWHPIGGALLTVAAEIVSMALVFVIMRAVAGPIAGLAAAGLWAVSPILVYFGGSQWNPQLMLPFALLSLYAALRIARRDGHWLVVLVPALLIAWQMHDPVLLLLPLIALVVAWRWRSWANRRSIGLATAGALAVTAPFIATQATTRLRDLRAMFDYVATGLAGGGRPAAIDSPIDRITTAAGWLRRALPEPEPLGLLVAALAVIGLGWAAWTAWRTRSAGAAWLLLLAATPLMFVLWRAPFHSHYLLLVFALAPMLAGAGLHAITAVWPRLLMAPAVAVVMIVVAAGAGLSLARTAGEQLPDRRWDNRLSVVRQVIADAAGAPFALRIVSSERPMDGWRAPWQYATLYAGTPPAASRVDLPTYAIFDPADHEGGGAYGGMVSDGLRWVRFDAPILAQNVATGEWSLEGRGSGLIESSATGDVVRLSSDLPWGRVDALMALSLEAGQRYVVRFEVRSSKVSGSESVYMQVIDAGGRVTDTYPTGAGLVAGPGDDWLTMSFFADMPAEAISARLILRSRGMGNAWYRRIEVLPVTLDRAPR
jgi:4-amino-4-deoxy-L-arabinose transferase-like glycosyltransferase